MTAQLLANGECGFWPNNKAADSVCPLPCNGVPATLSVAGCPWRGRVGEGVARTHEPCCVAPPPPPPPPRGGGGARPRGGGGGGAPAPATPARPRRGSRR